MTDPALPDPTTAPAPAPTSAPGAGLDTVYNSSGQPMTPEQVAEAEAAAADAGPPGMPPASAADAPFSEGVVPHGWSRAPTAEEVAYLNGKYPVSGEAPPEPTAAPAPAPPESPQNQPAQGA